jgi:uncharacterized protein YdhG (YjbR/CyaY superfamily)
MKRASAGALSLGARGEAAPQTMDEYLAGVPEPARSTLEKVRSAIRSAAPKDATECISYGIPTFRYEGPLVGFAAFSKHCSFFPMSVATIDKLKDQLQGLRASKGTLHFPLDKPLPAALVKKLVKARVEENERRMESRRGRTRK